MSEHPLLPQMRSNQIGREAIERDIRATIRGGALSHGWIISGPLGSGKATLAFRIARGLLDSNALSDDDSFEMSEATKVFRQISANAHPDLFVAQRLWDEKKNKFQTEITVETIRKLTNFLTMTASQGGARIAIVDTADDLNRNAANALLKALEEPPAGALLLLLSSSPGRLLPTIRSRCRQLTLPPLSEAALERFLVTEGIDAGRAKAVSSHAQGRPGYALQLATDEGEAAITLAESFLTNAKAGKSLKDVSASIAGKNGDTLWPIFREIVLGRLSEAARASASGIEAPAFNGANSAMLLDAWQKLGTLIQRAEALNLDRAQLINAMAQDLFESLQTKAA